MALANCEVDALVICRPGFLPPTNTTDISAALSRSAAAFDCAWMDFTALMLFAK